MNAPESFTLEMTRFIRAPRDKVFDAFTRAEVLAAWMGPRGMTVDAAQADASPGGAWRVAMRARDGSTFVVAGHYQTLERPARLSFTWKWEGDNSPIPHVQTLVVVDLVETTDGTDLRMTHSGFPAAAARDGHQSGWTSTFNRLNDLLDPRGSAGTITLFGDARSTYTRSARMALAEKAIAYTLQTTAPHTPEQLAVHPFGRIPALRDGGIDVWETSAIVHYIDECFDTGTSLRPGSILERTRSLQWSSAISSYLYDTMIRRYVLQMLFPRGEGGRPDRAVIDVALNEMPAQLAALETVYTRSAYLAGNSLSLADLLLAPILAYVQQMPEGGAMMAGYPQLLRGQSLVRERASFSATQPH